MNRIHVAAAVLNQTPLDWEGNQQRIVSAIRLARDRGASLVCLPELCISGYGCEDAFQSPGVHRESLTVLRDVLPKTKDLVVCLGFPLFLGGALYNVSGLAVDGQLAGVVGKQNLAGDGLHYEPRWFKPWTPGTTVRWEFDGQRIPVGDLVFDCHGVRLGFEICEDAWVADRVARTLEERGVDIIVNPSASHFAFGKHGVRRRLVRDGSRTFGVGYVYANLVGNEAGRAIYDGDSMIASQGRIVAAGPRFSYRDFHVTTAVLDVDAIRSERTRNSRPSIPVDRGSEECVSVDYQFPEGHAAFPASTSSPKWESSSLLKHEEFTRAVTLGLFDYLRKSRSHGFVVSLSGGADSAAVAVLAARMVRLAVTELGIDGFRTKLPYLSELQPLPDEASIVEQLLLCVYQATRNSSSVTRNAANRVANGVNASLLELNVSEIVDAYVNLIEQATDRSLTWTNDDIPLQNIQARTRGPSVWLLANLRQALLLATSNRSEAAVGYTTMDGDTCGGLSPIAGIDKAFLREWLRWMEREGPQDLGCIPELRAVNMQVPTAELRPQDSGQTDESDLMPYELLDFIERLAIRDKMTPLEVFQQAELEYGQYSREQLVGWVERFFQLWCRNQWKRERYAPSFHLDDENLDPKTWCRFPILSGGFDRELDELRKFVAG